MDAVLPKGTPEGPGKHDDVPCIMVIMTLDVRPEVAAALEAMATARGLSVEELLEQLVQKELPLRQEDAVATEDSGMVWESGLFVYRTGRPLPSLVVDDAIRQVREERVQHILGRRP